MPTTVLVKYLLKLGTILLISPLICPLVHSEDSQTNCQSKSTLLAAGQGSSKKIAQRNALYKLNKQLPSAPVTQNQAGLNIQCRKRLLWSCVAALQTCHKEATLNN
ncbi:MAG: hypothetical protein ACRBHB_03430 [Arenicella sp.]